MGLTENTSLQTVICLIQRPTEFVVSSLAP